MKPIICRFGPYCVKFLQIVCLLNAGLEHTRFNHVFENVIILFPECSIGACQYVHSDSIF